MQQTALILSLTVLVGCGASDVAPTVSEDTPSPVDDAASSSEDTQVKEVQNTNASAESLDQTVSKKRFLLTEFEAPYPNRVNPFAPPSRALRQTQRSDNSESSVVLLGFAKLDEPKAILDIDGVVSPLANGDQYAGVQVISIEPPNAVIQRGRDRWTASIE